MRDKKDTPYDVIVVGASIAGLYTGMKLAEAGLSVCIIDRKKEIGRPVRCGEATGNRAELARFITVDESWIVRDIRGFVAHTPGQETMVLEARDMGVILYRDRFEKALAYKAQTFGAQFFFKTVVSGLIRNNGAYTGVVFDTGEELTGSLIIGADGAESKVGRWAGITDVVPLRDAFAGIQYRINSDFCHDGFLHFFIGSSVIPGGYIWVFPKSDTEISVGAGVYRGNTYLPKVKEVLDRFIERNIPAAQKDDMITGCVPLSICPLQLSRGNVMVIGDAARQVNPLTAGGIMNTLEAADMAVQALLHEDVPSNPQNLARAYSQKWARTQRRQQKIFYLFKEIFLECSDRDIALMFHRVPRFFRRIDRSTPFKFPLFTLLRIGVLLFSKAVKHLNVLWK